MPENTNPFSRRRTKLMTTDGASVGTIAEVSTKDDNTDVENMAIEKFIPSPNADVDEGFNRMINILNRQRLDDIRAGVQNPGPELSIPSGHEDPTPAEEFKMPSLTPDMITSMFRKEGSEQHTYSGTPNTSVFNNVAQEDKEKINVFSRNTQAPSEEKVQFAVPNYKKEVPSPPPVDIVNTNNEPSTDKEPEKPKFTPNDVLPLLDSIINYGYASETFNIRGNKITIRTQFFWEENAIRDEIEKNITQDTMRVTAEALLQHYALASCLVSVGGNYFRPINSGTPEELRRSLMERVAFLNTLPSILVYYINKRRGEFNDKVIYLSENFDEVLKAF